MAELNAARTIAAAEEQAGLDDWGGNGFVAGLRRLYGAIESEAGIDPVPIDHRPVQGAVRCRAGAAGGADDGPMTAPLLWVVALDMDQAKKPGLRAQKGSVISEEDRTDGVARLKVQKVSQIVANDIRSRIARGDIADGDMLAPEPELIQQYGVSRPTLREAIRILETEGLVTTTRGGPKGARVHHPDSAQAARHAGLVLQLRGATIMDVFEMASILVPPAARKVAERRHKVDISELYRLHAAMEQAREAPRELTRLVRRFDVTLCGQ